MFPIVLSLLIILSFQKHIRQDRPPINDRIELLKQLLNEEIKAEQATTNKINPTEILKDYKDLMTTKTGGPDADPIKPIIQFFDPPHKKKKHKHRHAKNKRKLRKRKGLNHLKSSSNITLTKFDDTEKFSATSNHTLNKSTPANVFHRRIFDDYSERSKPQKWTHCLDLIAPYLKGYKDTLGPKRVDLKDGTVLRLIQLLSLNTTGFPKEDIVSILYQISNLQLRIFQWDVDAITSLFNVIIPRNWHDFKGLKAGVKALFQKWHLDTSNIVSFMQQSRVFRPPCIAITDSDVSTKSSRALRYTTPTAKNTDSDCDD